MTDKLYHIIYKTTCRVNGKQYIGVHSTNSLDDKYLGSSKQLQNDIALFGSENFSREILEMCETRDLALSRERVLVNEVWVDRPHTYNLHVGGAAWPYGHRVFSIEHRQKLSEARKKQVRQKHTEEAKRKMSVGKTGKPRPDVAARSREAAGANHWCRGRHQTPEQIQKRMASTRKWLESPSGRDYRLKVSERMKKNNPNS